MAKITLHVTPTDATELAAITAALAPFVSSREAEPAGDPTSREALLDAMRSALKAGKRAEVAQVLQEFGAARATELKDEDVAAATAMVVAL